VEQRIKSWDNNSAESNFFIGLDGLPGSGKSTLTAVFHDLAAKIGVTLYIIPVDNFIQTDRDSPQRIELTKTKDLEIFWRLYYSQSAVSAVLENIKRQNGNSFELNLPKMYSRKTGKTGPGSLSVPVGRKIILLEGVNSTKFIHELQQESGAEGLKVLIYAMPETALKRAVQRDTNNNRRSTEEAYEMRKAEYRHLVPVINGENSRKADMIYLQT
jgi:uridine kinase